MHYFHCCVAHWELCRLCTQKFHYKMNGIFKIGFISKKQDSRHKKNTNVPERRIFFFSNLSFKSKFPKFFFIYFTDSNCNSLMVKCSFLTSTCVSKRFQDFSACGHLTLLSQVLTDSLPFAAWQCVSK